MEMKIDYLRQSEIGVDALVTGGNDCYNVHICVDGGEWEITRHSIAHADFFRSSKNQLAAALDMRWPRQRKLTSGQITKIKKLLRPELNARNKWRREKKEAEKKLADINKIPPWGEAQDETGRRDHDV